MKNILKLMLKQYFLPKWIVLLYDLAVMGTVFSFSTYLVANFSAEQAELQNAIRQVIASTFIFLIVYLIIKPHYNIIRHTTLKDFSSIVIALTIGSSGLLILCLLYTSDAADEEDSVDLGGRRI